MPFALIDFGIIIGLAKDFEPVKAVLKLGQSIHILDPARPTCPIFDLTRRITVQHEQPARSKGALHPLKNAFALLRTHKLNKDRDNRIILLCIPVKGKDVSVSEIDLHAARIGQRACFGLTDIRVIKGHDVMPLPGQPDRVAALTISDNEHFAPLGDEASVQA